MKKQKRLLSLILSFAIVATTFSSLGSIFSSAADTTLDESLKVTKSLEAYDSVTGNEEITKDWTNSAGVVSINANPEHYVTGSGENLYKDYKLEMNAPKKYAYAKEGGKYYVDWADNTVESVSYTILPCAYLGNNGNFDFYSNIPLGNGQAIQYGFRSDQGYMQFRAGSFQTQLGLWLNTTVKYYKDDTLITHSNISELLGQSSAEIANEIKVTVNYTKKADGSYILKNIVAEVDPEIKISNVSGVTASAAKTAVTITPKSELVITDPQFCLPGSGYFNEKAENAFYNYTYIKDASITYYQNPDTAKIPEFVEAYNKIKNLTVNEAEANKEDIVACMNIYNGYDDTYKSYVGDERSAKLTELYNAAMKSQLTEEVSTFLTAYDAVKDLTVETVKASDLDTLKNCIGIYNGYDDVHKNFVSEQYNHLAELYARATYLKTGDGIKTSSINKNMLSDKTVSEQMWQYTCLQDYDKYVYSTASAHTNNTYNRFFKLSEVGGFGFEFDGTTAKQTVTGKTYKPAGSAESEAMQNATSCFVNYVKKDFLPEDISNLSATVSLHPGSYNIFFGENTNSSVAAYKNFKYNDGSSDENDFPRYGLRINVGSDGTVSAQYTWLNITDVTSNTNSYYTGKYMTSSSTSNVVNALVYSAKNGYKLDMTAERLTVSLDLSHKYTYKNGSTSFDYIQPVITLKDSNGTVISQASDVDGSGEKPYLGKMPHSSVADYMPTDITGFAISSYNSTYNAQDTSGSGGYVSAPYTDTLTLYDFDIVGAATVNALGATIKKTQTVSEQDLRFGFKFGGENTYLINQGYTVKNYGAVVAVNGALEDGDSLTLTSKYKDAYSSLGAPKVVTIDGAPTYGEQYNVRIGLSAKDSKNLGLVYRVRPYITYSKEGAEDIVIYSEDTSATNAYTPRSIFSTAKNIAKAMAANANFESVKQEMYDVNGTPISYEEIKSIFDGTNTGKSYDKIEGTDIMLAEALTAFTAKHIDLLS